MKTAFGNNLRALRTKKGYSQRDLAKALKTTQPTIANYENAGKYPQKEIIKNNLLKVLECSEVDLYGYSDGYYNRTTAQSAEVTPKYAKIYKDKNLNSEKIEECIIDTNTGKSFARIKSKRAIDSNIKIKYPKGFFLKISDQSMNKYIPQDSYIFIAPTNKDEYNNHVCAVTIDGFNTIFRRVVFTQYEGLITLIAQSTTDKYDNALIDPVKNKNFKIIGRAVWFSNDGEEL